MMSIVLVAPLLLVLASAPSIPGPPPTPAPFVAPPPTPVLIPAPKLVQPRPVGAIYSPTAEPGAGLRRYGLGATIIGVVLGIGGGIAATTNPCGKDGATGSDCRSDIRNAVAMTMGVTGFGVVIGGVTAMSIGQAQRRHARLELAGFGVSLRGQGGTVSLRLRF